MSSTISTAVKRTHKSNFQFKIILLLLTAYFLLPTTISAATIARPLHNSGLVGYWSFEEGTGNSQTFDRSGRGNTGTLTSMDPLTDWVNGATSTGQALDFDGSDDYVQTTSNQLKTANDFTISIWFKTNTLTFATMLLWEGQSSGNGFGSEQEMHLSIGQYSGINNKISFNLLAGVFSDNADALVLSATLADNNWHHALVTVSNLNSSPSGSLYLDGVLASTDTGTTGATTRTSWDTDLRMGRPGASTRYFNGRIDEVRIYNRALSADEVARLYNLKKPKVASGIDNTGLVGYWAFEEGTGTRAEDSSFNTNTGTLTLMNNSDWVQGRVGTALDFDGSDDYVVVGSDASLRPASAITICAWVFRRSDGSTRTGDGNYQDIIIRSSTSNNSNYAYEFESASKYIFRIGVGIELSSADTVSNELNTWIHLCVAYSNADGGYLYTNGIAVDSIDGTGDDLGTNTETVYIGGRSGASDIMDGKLDEVRIYNRALSASEIKALYDGSKQTVVNKTNKSVLTNGLVGHWTFDGKDIYQTSALDSSGQGNTGTLTNGPTPIIGKIGQALNFDGSDDYVVLPDEGLPNGASAASFSAWVYPKAASSGAVISSMGNNWKVNTEYVFSARSGTKIELSIIDSAADLALGKYTTNNVISLNEWSHIVAIWRGGNDIDFYANGVQITTLTTQSSENPTSLTDTGIETRIGRRQDGFEQMNGYIDDVRVYNRALSADEVKVLYNSGR
jgi:hypothetical protein